MQQEIIISGFGGQGTLFAGQLLAYAAMDSGYHVTWIPSYGPEMRGGKARCTVVVSDAEIGSPLVRRPGAAVVLNIPSMEAFEPAVKSSGVLVVNSSSVWARWCRPPASCRSRRSSRRWTITCRSGTASCWD
jgi:2-oxoglutarate ferredoxin oxidoreductase subunit gamma